MREVKIGHLYRHFKGLIVYVLDIVYDSESNEGEELRKIVIYRHVEEPDITWARPYEMFISEVDHEKYPEIKQKYRFEEYTIE